MAGSKKIESSVTQYPDYADLDITRYDLVSGFYTLGFCQYHRPDCLWITTDIWQSYLDYSWLNRIIEDNLPNRKICIVVWDEEIIGLSNNALATVLNQYVDEPVYLITLLSETNQEIYRRISSIRCKILSLCWWLLNDALTYYAVKKTLDQSVIQKQTDHQYLCMVGNAYSSHKSDLIECLIQNNLNQHGLITVQNYSNHPAHFRDFVSENPVPPYQNLYTKRPIMAAQRNVNGVWISGNVENFLHIEETYDMPLIINAETSVGIFQSTEKSLWPSLLGRMYLIYGGPGVMSYIQQFHDMPQTRFVNTRFDSMVGDWSEKAHRDRLDVMINDNVQLIKHAREIYMDLRSELECSRWTIGQNLYNYFLSQLDKIRS